MASGDNGERKLAFALLVASLAFAFAFRGRLFGFWARMTLGTGSLGLLALAQTRRSLDLPRRGDLISGALSAGLLYALFQVSDRLARACMRRSGGEIAAIYRLRDEARRPVIAFLLATVIAPGEELFWRGFVQRHLATRYCLLVTVPLAAALYSAVHVPSMNLTLIGAAGVAGLFWSVQYALQKRLPPVIFSHILWDIWIFLVAPTPGQKARGK